MLSAIVLTLNEERHLPECLASLSWADEVVVFDSGSTDATQQIATAAGARLVTRQFDHYAGQRDAALASVSSEWVLFVDADERIPVALRDEIRSVLARPEAGWWIPRHNYLFGTLTRHTGWYPDYQLRLLRRMRAHYDPTRPVHELVLLDGPSGHLTQPMVHLNYETVGEFVRKQTYYAEYDADRLAMEGVRARPHHLLSQPLRHFWWRFVTLSGWRDGLHGLRLSLLMARFEFEKYRLLLRRQRATT
ncbi:MAG TPA: glycosyltransferase family 2 protein [Anaerolineales bacterium]|nr:glycosyltransferase family 2 protein [Anaerolineales bacterium]HRF50667.1 glycosyltransferase family 2 protein [Anaerolineales bacterium]